MSRPPCVRHCLEDEPLELMRRYLDGKPDLSNDDREVLLFALYMESKQNNGLACRAIELLGRNMRCGAVPGPTGEREK